MYLPGYSPFHCPPVVSWRRWLSSWELLEGMLAEEQWLESYESLKRQFELLAVDVDDQRLLTKDKFEAFIGQMNPRWAQHVSDILFPLMDCDADGLVNLQDFAVAMLATFLEGSFQSSSTSAYFRARRQLLFTFYDMDGRGYLTQSDWHRLIEDSMEYWTHHEKANQQRIDYHRNRTGCTADMIMCMETLTQSPKETWNESASRKLMRLNAFWKDESGVVNFDTFYEACDRRLISDRGIRLRFKNLPLPSTQSFQLVQKTLVAGVEATQSLVQRAVKNLPKFGLHLWTLASDLRNSGPPSNAPVQAPEQPSQASSPILAGPGFITEPICLSPDVHSPSTIIVSPPVVSPPLVDSPSLVVSPVVSPPQLVMSPELSPGTNDPVPDEFEKQAEAPPLLVPTTTASEAEDLIADSSDFVLSGDSVVTPFMKEQEMLSTDINRRIVELYLRRCVALANGHLTITDPAGDEGQALLNDLMDLAILVEKHCMAEQLVVEFHPKERPQHIWVVGSLNGDITDTQAVLKTVLGVSKTDPVPNNKIITANTSLIFSGNVLCPGGLRNATISSLQVLACVWVLKVMFPERVVLLRGPNEAGLHTDAGQALMDAFGVDQTARLFNRICDVWESTSVALLAGQSFCVFGGSLTLALLGKLPEVRTMPKPLLLDSKEPNELEQVFRESYSAKHVDNIVADRYCLPGSESLPKVIIEQQQLSFGIQVRPIKSCVNIIAILNRAAEMTDWAAEQLLALS